MFELTATALKTQRRKEAKKRKGFFEMIFAVLES